MLSPELMQKIRSLQIRTSHLVTEAIAGSYQSVFKGHGMEFEDARIYLPGDDVRNIDWNLTARTGTPHIKNYREERELTVILLIDVSASKNFGTRKRIKNELAAEVSAILAHTAMRKNDKVGAILFSDQIEHFIPPKKGRSHIWRVIRAILTFKPLNKGTNISVALDFLNKVIHRKAVVFLISDFMDHTYEKSISISNKRHDLIAVCVNDPAEQDLPKVGLLEVMDAETGETCYIDTQNSKVRSKLKRTIERKEAQRKQLFRTLGLDSIQLQTDRDVMDPILEFFLMRMKKIRK